MTGNQKPERIEVNGWPFRVQKPTSQPQSHALLLLLHGHLGDENAMWILTNPLPETCWMIAPRAPVKTGENGYSWHENTQTWPGLDHYQKLAQELLDHIEEWQNREGTTFEKIHIMGFSQGAVMAYALAVLYPDRIQRVAALAGFLPREWERHLVSENLQHQSFFIAHGTEDNIIPIERARRTADQLKQKGADVTFCEADSGHKLSANCFNGLGAFFEESTDR